MKIKTYKTWKFEELDEKQKEKVIQKYGDINVDCDWWESTYQDAERVGVKIEAFNIDRGSYCKGKFISSSEETAHLIEKEHGETCETFKTAKEYLFARDATIEGAERDENGDFTNENELDNKLDELDGEFLKSILEDYLTILRKEYEYLTSEEAIIETIKANDYDFNEKGEIS